MNKKEHRLKHVALHQALDELLADYLLITGKMLSNSTIYDVMKWSNQQTIKPTRKRILK